MGTNTGAATRRRFSLSFTDVAFVLLSLLLFAAHVQAVLDRSLYSLLFVIQNAVAITAILVHRPPEQAAVPLKSVLIAWAGALLPLLMHIPPEAAVRGPVSLAVTAVGSVIATAGIIMLGRSFAVEPGNRGIRTNGLYRVVRHPIYAAYLFSFGGVLISYPSWWNATVYAVWICVQVVRIDREEKVLRLDEQYRAYSRRVRYRLIPGIW